MLAIKLQRIGKKHQPSYRVVVAERRSKMAAPPVEDLGSYNPSTKVAILKTDRLQHWMNVGAKPTVTAHNLFVKEGVIKGAAVPVKMPKAVVKEVAPVAESAAPEASAPAESPAVEESAPEEASSAE